MPPAVKSKKAVALPAKVPTARKSKFQADLAPAEDRAVATEHPGQSPCRFATASELGRRS